MVLRIFRGRTFRGFTLIEVLAVVVLIALIAGATLTSVAGTTDLVRQREAMASLIDLDHRARLVASQGSQIQLVATSGGGGAVLTSIDSDDDVLAHVALPFDLHVTYRVNDQPADRLTFDARGRSSDYAIVLHDSDRTFVQPVHGLTGWSSSDESLVLDHAYGVAP